MARTKCRLCGVKIKPKESFKYLIDSLTLHFCSENCKSEWLSTKFSYFEDNQKAEEKDKTTETASLFSQGKKLFAKGQYIEALNIYQKIIELDPNNEKALLNKAILLGVPNSKEAIECYDQILAINPVNETALLNKGRLLDQLGHYENALEYYERVIELNPLEEMALYQRYLIHLFLGRETESLETSELRKVFEKNIEQCNYQIELDPENADLFSKKALLLQFNNNYEPALECIDVAIKLNPMNAESWDEKGSLFFYLKRYNEAIECFDKALAINPNQVTTWFNKGNALAEGLGNYEDAITCYNKVIDLNPNRLDAQLNKAFAYQMLGCFAKSIEFLEKILSIDQNNEDALFIMATCFMDLGQNEESIQFFDKIIELNPLNADALYDKGVVLGNLGQNEEALSYYNQSLKIDSENYKTWCSKGITLKDLGFYEEAIKCFDKSIELNPVNDKAWCYKGHVLGDLEYNEKAILCYDKAIELHPEDSSYYLHKSLLLPSVGKKEDAIKTYDKYLKLEPSGDIYLKGFLLEINQQYVESIECFDKKIQSDPKDTQAWFEKGKALFLTKNNDIALECCNKVIELDPKNKNAYGLKSSILICQNQLEQCAALIDTFRNINTLDEDLYVNAIFANCKLEKYEHALLLCDECLEINMTNIDFLEAKGSILQYLNRTSAAIECYDEILRINPKSEKTLCDKAGCLEKIGQIYDSVKMYEAAFNINPLYEIKKGLQLYNFVPIKQNSLIIEQNRQVNFNQIGIQKCTTEISGSIKNINSTLKEMDDNVKSILQSTNHLIADISLIKDDSNHSDSEMIISKIEQKIDDSFSKLELQPSQNKDYDSFMIELKNKVGNNYWDYLEPNTKEYLTVAEYISYSLSNIELAGNEVDHSPVVIEVCRSIENELRSKLFIGFLEYASREYKDRIDELNDDSEFYKILKNYQAALDKKPSAELTLGTMYFILSISLKEEIKSKTKTKLVTSLHTYLRSRFDLNNIVSDQFLKAIYEIRSLRNSSAHTDKLDKKSADKVKKLGPNILNQLLTSNKNIPTSRQHKL